MINNGNKSAFPFHLPADHGDWTDGLTKREYFAAMAMQGIISTMTSQESISSFGRASDKANMNIEEYISALSVKHSDFLIQFLEKKENDHIG